MIALLLYIVTVWVTLFLGRVRLGALHVALSFMTVQGIAVYNCSIDIYGWLPTILFFLGVTSVIAGFFAQKYFIIQGNIQEVVKDKWGGIISLQSLYVFSAVITIGVVYHFIIVGAPIMSQDLIVSRFDNASSGLFGIPGRMKLFGGFFLLFLVAVYRAKYPDYSFVYRKLWLLSLILLFLIELLTGSKGGLLDFAIALVVLNPYVIKINTFQKVYRGWDRKKILVVIVIGIIAFLALGLRFLELGTYEHREIYSLSDLIYTRLFYMSGESFVLVVNGFTDLYGYGFGDNFVSDMSIFFSKFGLSDGDGFTTVQRISALQTGTILDTNNFIVPVTISAFGYLFLEFGWVGILVGGFLIGWFFSHAIRATYISKTPIIRAFWLMMQMMIIWLLEKGNFGYWLPNVLISSFIFMILFIIILTFIRMMRSNKVYSYQRL